MTVYLFKNGLVIKEHTVLVNGKGLTSSEKNMKILYPKSMLREVKNLVYSYAVELQYIHNHDEIDIKHYDSVSELI